MKNFILIFGVVAGAIFLGGCEEGPSGPHPAHETIFPVYDVGGDSVYYRTSFATITLNTSDSSSSMMTFRTDTTTFGPTGGSFIFKDIIPYQPVFDVPDPRKTVANVRVTLKQPITGPSTINFEPVVVKNGSIGIFNPDVDVTQGIVVTYMGRDFYPVSGSIVVTEMVQIEGVLVKFKGYINGKLKSVWPRTFESTASQPLPPGFDINNPSLIGDEMTVHSLTFEHNAAGPIFQ